MGDEGRRRREVRVNIVDASPVFPIDATRFHRIVHFVLTYSSS